MLAKDIMTGHAAHCTPRTSLRDAATLMVDHECGCLPVAKDFEPGSEIIGMITERDLICRAVAEGLDPVMSTVWLAMTMPAVTVHDDATVEECHLRARHHFKPRYWPRQSGGGCGERQRHRFQLRG